MDQQMDDDTEFEVTAEMLVHGDMDDERTLDEEEQQEIQEEVKAEVDNLQEESDMPIEELLARYSYGSPSNHRESSSDTSSESGNTAGKEIGNAPTVSPGEAAIGQNVVVEAGQSVLLGPESEGCQTGFSEILMSKETSHTDLEDQPGPSGITLSSTAPPPALENDVHVLHCSETILMDDTPLLKGDVLLQNNALSRHSHLYDHAVRNFAEPLENKYLERNGRVRNWGEKTEETISIGVAGQKRSRSNRGESSRSRLRPEVPERRSIRLMTNDERAAVEVYFSSLMEEGSDEDEEYLPNEDWKQEIRVGSAYQAVVPAHPMHTPYPPHPPPGELLWTPQETSEGKVSEYLESVSEKMVGVAAGAERDNEQALQVLQRHYHDVNQALEQIHKNGVSRGMQPWTEDECKKFEAGLRAVGKDFFQLRKQIPTRTVKELVEFYYLWKKTERYDHFIQQGRIGRKKISCPPGHISDFMDKYLDMRDPEAVDLHYGTTTMHAEVKKEGSS